MGQSSRSQELLLSRLAAFVYGSEGPLHVPRRAWSERPLIFRTWYTLDTSITTLVKRPQSEPALRHNPCERFPRAPSAPSLAPTSSKQRDRSWVDSARYAIRRVHTACFTVAHPESHVRLASCRPPIVRQSPRDRSDSRTGRNAVAISRKANSTCTNQAGVASRTVSSAASRNGYPRGTPVFLSAIPPPAQPHGSE
ncbi:hypothetical protein M8818_004203 [Zalaria obscura]|uniref:Uncharacterized protein n=1 Tax=Zalaria obscura TaxID=2024903 RepID=A0ACC3SD93_9PEZI